jgi:hypothetical protein
MLPIRTAHLAFLLLLMPVLMNGMNTSEKIIAVPLCAPDETIWHATFAGDGQEIKPTVVLSKDFLFNIQSKQHAERVRMCRKAVRIDSEDNCECFFTDSHKITHPAYKTTGEITLKQLSNEKTHIISPARNNTPQKYTPWCAVNVAKENPVLITTHNFLKNRKIHCVDHINNRISSFRIPVYNRTQKQQGQILTINASPCSEQIRKIALAIREHSIINDKKVGHVCAYLINVTNGDSDKLELRLQGNFPIKLEAGELLAGLGWTTNGDKLVVLRKPAVQGMRRIACSNIILETYSPISGKCIARANMPIPSSGHLEMTTELSNDYLALIARNTLATTPRNFVLDNTLHDMKNQLPTKDLQRASAHNIISLLRHRELNGSKIAYHQAAARQAIEPVQQQ